MKYAAVALCLLTATTAYAQDSRPTFLCETPRDCLVPTSPCNVREKAECVSQLCVFPPKDCGARGACSREGACITSPVTMTIKSNKATYDWSSDLFDGGPVNFTATFKNITKHTVTVSLFQLGNVTIQKLTLGGKPVPFRYYAGGDAQKSPEADQVEALRTLDPGEIVTMQIDGMSSFEGLMRIFAPAEVGEYRVIFRYWYLRGDDGKPEVFHGALTSNEVTFKVIEPKPGTPRRALNKRAPH